MITEKITQKKWPHMVATHRNAHLFIAQLPQLQQYH